MNNNDMYNNNYNQNNMNNGMNNNNNNNSYNPYNMNNSNNNYNNYNQNNMNNNMYNNDNNQGNMNNNNMNSNYNNSPYSNGYKLTLNRKKSFVGALIAYKVFIDNNVVGKIKNGETLTFDVIPGQHTISINNNKNPIVININGDTTADIAVYGTNEIGITNVNGQGQNFYGNENNIIIKKCQNQATAFLISSIALPIVSVIIYFTFKYLIAAWIYGINIGYGIINIYGLKHIKEIDNKKYNQLLIMNFIGIAIGIIAVIVTIFIINKNRFF